jgi:hypothetical protein
VGAVLAALSVAAVGVQQIIFYPHYVLGLENTMAMGAIMPSDMPNLRGILYLIASNGASKSRYFEMLVIFVSGVLYLLAAWISALPDLHLPDRHLHGHPPNRTDQQDLKFALAVFATVLVSYHGLGYDLCLLVLPALLLLGQLGGKIRVASWTGSAISVGLAILLFSPLQLVLLMRYNHLALLGWPLLLCFAGLAGQIPAGELISQPLRT